MSKQSLSNEQWALVQSLFNDMLDSADPLQFINGQSQDNVREALENLWRQHKQAETRGFLEEQITLVKELGLPNGSLTFQPGQMLAERFAVLRVLGSGGMGEVYLADDRRLTEMVALKTIKTELAKDRESRARFLNEVRRARQVTHPNVCRIFDLFEHDGLPFYSMEYLAGATLAEVLAAGQMKPERARQIAVQTAEGLWTAHRNGILHCDFKPANVILTGSGKSGRAVITDFGLALALAGSGVASEVKATAGTPFYMAPEVLAGDWPAIRSDVYAFGKVLDELLPGHRLVARCTAPSPNDRPESMEQVVNDLRGGSTRRTWILGSVVAAATSMGAVYLRDRWRPRIPLGSRQRVRVNGFTPNDAEAAKAVRTLMMMALRQSPLLSVVGDRGYLAGDGATIVKAGFALPLVDLLATARNEKANLVIDGRLEERGQGLRLLVTVYDIEKNGARYRTEVAVRGKHGVVQLAELAATNLRKEAFGESAFHSGYRALDQVTSSSPAAVDLYFQAVFHYEKTDALSALTLLDQAIALDPNFVLAHHYKALALSSQWMMESAQASSEKAFSMRGRVTERERNWIESQYYNIIGAWTESAGALRKNTVLYPDEAVFERQLAFALMRLGQYGEAIPHSRRAVDLDPFSENNTSELLVNLAEAGNIDDCFNESKTLASSGRSPNLLQYDIGLAYLQKGDYAQAETEFAQFGNGNSARGSWSRLSIPIALIMSGRFIEAMEMLEGDLALDSAKLPAYREESRTYKRRAWLGELKRLTDKPGSAAEQAEELVSLRPLACNLLPLREGALLALELKELRLAQMGLDRLSSVAAAWPSAHSQGAVWLTRAVLGEVQGDAASKDLFAKAKGAWADPLNLFFIARWEGSAGLLETQLASLKELDRLRGKIFKHHFAGLAVLGWLEQAKCLQKMALFAESLRLYDRVAEHWSNPQAAGSTMDQAIRERKELRRRLQ
jgi:tetratricopeptide (TPR) repeat protein